VEELPSVLAVMVAVWADVTALTMAEKLAVVAPAGTVTEAGTVTALLLLASVTACPPVGAAELSVTVQLSVAAPVMEPFAQVTRLEIEAGVVAAAPVPFMLMLS